MSFFKGIIEKAKSIVTGGVSTIEEKGGSIFDDIKKSNPVNELETIANGIEDTIKPIFNESIQLFSSVDDLVEKGLIPILNSTLQYLPELLKHALTILKLSTEQLTKLFQLMNDYPEASLIIAFTVILLSTRGGAIIVQKML